MLSGDVGFPPSVQWIGRTPYVTPLVDMVQWGMGPAFGIAGWVSGGTGAGKTTLLNCLSNYIPENERIVTIEDSAELKLQQEHVVRLGNPAAKHRGPGLSNGTRLGP